METLPNEISQKIFSSLTYRDVSSAGKVCRSWRNLTSQAQVWKTFYIRRWGQDKETTALCNFHGAWKSAFECHDRLDRVGKDWTIIREGDNIYTTENGQLCQLLSTTSGRISPVKIATTQNPKSAEGYKTTSRNPVQRDSDVGLVDKLFEVLADLHTELHKATKHR